MGWAGGSGGSSPSWEDEINNAISGHRTSREESYNTWLNAKETHKGTHDNLTRFGLTYDTNKRDWDTIEENEANATIENSDLLTIKDDNQVQEKNWVEYSFPINYGSSRNRSVGVAGGGIDVSKIKSGPNLPTTPDDTIETHHPSGYAYYYSRSNYQMRKGWVEVDTANDADGIIDTVKDKLDANGSNNGTDLFTILQGTTTGSDSYWDPNDGHRFGTTWKNTQMGTDIKDSRIRKGKVDVDNEYNKKWNDVTYEINHANVDLNNKNQAKNQAYEKIKEVANRTQGEDFLEKRGDIETQGLQLLNTVGFNDEQKAALASQANEAFKSFYRTEKLNKWSTDLAAPIPGVTGSQFDPEYYMQQSQAAKDTWDDAVANDDIDITEKYNNDPSNITFDNFALQHWTNQGRQAGLRAYAPVDPDAATNYESSPQDITTDADIQAARDLQLGINSTDTYQENILRIPYIEAEYDKASSEEGDEYWKNLGDEWNLNEKNPEEFISLFRLSEREADKNVSFLHNINNPDYGGISELEDAVTEAAGDKIRLETQRFGALTKDVLKNTIAEIKKAKSKESFLGTIEGFPGYGEIMDVNKSLSNTLLGDLETGGYLNWMGGESTKDSLEKSMERITGIKNNVTHNWEKWYEDELKSKYYIDENSDKGFYVGEDDPETEDVDERVKSFYIGEDDPETEDVDERMIIEAEFGRKFIDEYLTKRFDQSKSMNEFVEYLDVRDSESNPFQTMSMLDALNLKAEMEAQKWQNEMGQQLDNGQRSESFDSKFYLNPSATDNIGKTSDYLRQSERVASDLEKAKNSPTDLIDENLPALGTWQQQIYRYGIDVNDTTPLENGLTVGENKFAQMHYDLIGQSQGFDGAEDFLNPTKIRQYVYENILPTLDDEALSQGSVFGDFITPEEFADDMLEAVDPNVPESWQEVLNSMEERGNIASAENWNGTYDDLKEMIMETMRGGSAQQIRENIKYLNEKRKRPTQERLGVLYIERESDYKPTTVEGETELFKTFQRAGYQGDEDSFYGDFFPDLNREDQKLLTTAGSDKSMGSFMNMDFSDPFASFSEISGLLGDDDEEDKEEKQKTSTQGTSFFSLDDDDDNDWDYKKKKTESTFGSLSNLFS